jgi:hypothetical protein
MTSENIQINIIDGKDLAMIEGLSGELAWKIIQHRDTQGYFKNHEDLKSVEGMSSAVSENLSRKIDWSLPVEEEKDVIFGIFYFSLAFYILWAFFAGTSSVFLEFGHFNDLIEEGNYSRLFVSILQRGSILLLKLLFFVALFLYGLRDITSNLREKRKLFRFATYSMFLGGLPLVVYGIGTVLYLSYITPTGWKLLWEEPSVSLYYLL